MFHFPAFPPHTLYIQMRVTGHDSCRVSPFGHPRITARLAAPRGLSQPPTSFIGSWCLGIHRVPLITWPQRCSRPLCSSQGTGGPDHLPAAYAAIGAVQRVIGPDRSGAGFARIRHLRCGGSVTRSLRTQQRAYGHPVPHHAFHALTGRTRVTSNRLAELVSVPPMSTTSA